MSEQNSPLTEASSASLDELFSRKPPFTRDELARMKQEFRRLRANWEKYEAGEAQKPKTKRAKSAPKSTIIDVDLFADGDGTTSDGGTTL